MTKLPLPSPRSPSGLDKKILAYAKQQLPEKRTYRPALWLSGLATASVVAIAVIIAIPEQPRVSAPTADSPRTAVNESADMEIMVQRRARKQSVPMAASAALYAEDDMAVAAAATMPILDSTTIHQQLREMAALVKRGESKQAALDYQKLKELCPHCDLPTTVEEAIEKYLTGD